ncbi:MAG: 3'-5' exonuclease domain-containing protein 2 [Pseudoflavonifractor sp.]|nr:3'-5' exonuclease domain-containing protein 2 [Alloprevotella sp.]MCM1117145.1 3'-5' exonuclease domain-containing protein 2 [Pseudoflavonifractor sp.]
MPTISISKEIIAEMPLAHFKGSVVIVDTPEKIEAAIARLYATKVVGFDTETRPNFHKGDRHSVSLMQVSTGPVCYLFRLNYTGLTDTLIHWLEDENCIKVGLSLKDDFHQLRLLCDLTPGGFVELQSMVKEYGIIDSSLQKIYAIIFGQRISKGQRLTNWEAPTLAPSQQAYASLDAEACLDIYNFLQAGCFNPALSPYKVDPSTPL